ncbi:hypothetical protein HK413_13880 [Mucilaginibacter sp. S1162]|uniref:Uncharacterized protein n=1 Tax=Mucilaginibacter humi TaxID=2732510 RepID=A0ABX1W5G7_9SPHI|nr:hypothetical protein [Mucilaginibacter humi]NNU34863.1 hypothetical protein [Mucilaginibacter humi]
MKLSLMAVRLPWLINMFLSDGPVESFKKLKLQVQKPAYKNPSFFK